MDEKLQRNFTKESSYSNGFRPYRYSQVDAIYKSMIASDPLLALQCVSKGN